MKQVSRFWPRHPHSFVWFCCLLWNSPSEGVVRAPRNTIRRDVLKENECCQDRCRCYQTSVSPVRISTRGPFGRNLVTAAVLMLFSVLLLTGSPVVFRSQSACSAARVPRDDTTCNLRTHCLTSATIKLFSACS